MFQKIGGDISMDLFQEVFLERLQKKGPVQLIALKISIRGLHFLKKIKRIFTNLSKYVPFSLLELYELFQVWIFWHSYLPHIKTQKLSLSLQNMQLSWVSYCITKTVVIALSQAGINFENSV